MDTKCTHTPSRNSLLSLGLGALAASCVLLSGCTQQSSDPVLALDECIMPAGSEVRCGTLTVPENPADPKSRQIELEYVIKPAKVRNKASDAVFFFAGGPGQAASEVSEMLMGTFDRVNNTRDLVFLDQRGTGEKSPFECEFEDDPELKDPLIGLTMEMFDAAKVKQCLTELEKKADMRFYATTTAMTDYEALRVKLGYDKINLWGASYGTRAALEYLRRYESKVRSVVLDGVAPSDMRLSVSMTRDASELFDRLLAECAANASCNKEYPNLAERTQALLTRISEAPSKVSLTHPITGEQKSYNINDRSLRALLFRPLYIPQLQSLIPGLLHSAANGDYVPLLTANLSMVSGNGLGGINQGMHASVVCAEDVRPLTASESAKAGSLFGPSFTKTYADMCAVWPAADVPADFAQPVKSNVPLLVLSGGRDPVTPPKYGEQVLKTLPGGKHWVAPNIGHGVSLQGCAPKLIREFITTASHDKVDGKCLENLPAPPAHLPMNINFGAAAIKPASSNNTNNN